MTYNKKTIFPLVLLVVSTSTIIQSQNIIDRTKLRSDYALQQNRDKYINDLNEKINSVFAKELSSNRESEWQGLFREIGLIYYRNDTVYKAIQKAVRYSQSASLKFKRSLVETILILYPNDFQEFIDIIHSKTEDPTLFAYTVHYELQQNDSLSVRENLSSAIIKKFPNWENIPQLKFMNYNLNNIVSKTPSLNDLFNHNFMEGKTIIYSIHRKNRSYAGLTIIKKPDGNFLKGENDSILYVNQLALSVSGLPGYLSQGNTPQGIFSIVGFYVSPTQSIGPTPNVLTRIPFEVPTDLFYHKEVNSTKWKLEDYQRLLPESWKEYFPIYESFYAGKTGRRKIVMHGSVDDLIFYKYQRYYPLTPSKGCLTTKEIWSEKTGKNIESEQSKLMNAFFSTGELEGFLVVVDINDKKSDVTIEEILPFLNE